MILLHCSSLVMAHVPSMSIMSKSKRLTYAGCIAFICPEYPFQILKAINTLTNCAAPIYVDGTRGSTSGSCGSFASPCSRIQDAITKCPNGNTVYIAPGKLPSPLLHTVLSRTNNHFSVVLMAAVAPSHFTSDKLSCDSGPVDVISCRFDQCWFQTVLRGICH